MGRGSGPSAKAGKGSAKGNGSPADKDKIDATAKPGTSASDAADQLNISPADKPHFVNGADDVDSSLKPGPDGKPIAPGPDAVKRWELNISVVERRYGRRAARAYSRGGYWALVKAVKTALAAGAVVGITVPGQGAVNAGMIGTYWATTR